MINEKEMTAPNVSVGADTEQSILKQTNNSIPDSIKKSNDILEKLKEMDRLSGIESDPNHIYSMTMEELFDIAYGTKPPIIENILTPGMYVIAGTPKVGKSFLMAQIAYYVSTGMQLWNNCVTQGDVLYLALEDRYERLQQRLSTQCLVMKLPSICTLQLNRGHLKKVLKLNFKTLSIRIQIPS